MESGFNFGLGFFGAIITWKFGIVILTILASIIVFIIGYIYYWYKQKTRKCPKCKSKEYVLFIEDSCISDKKFEKCKCNKCNNTWYI